MTMTLNVQEGRGKSKGEEPKAEHAKEPQIDPKTGKLPSAAHMRRWGMKEYPSDSFVRVTFLVTGSLSGERFTKGKSGDVPKAVFEGTLKPLRQAKLWEKPKPKVVAARPASDVGAFRRR